MPRYTFNCSHCACEFTLETTITERIKQDPTVFHCPQCQSTAISQNPNQKIYSSGIGEGKGKSACSGCTDGTCSSCVT